MKLIRFCNWYFYGYTAFLIGAGINDSFTVFVFALNALALIIGKGDTSK